MSEIGLITEQGDLGFGFDVLNEKDKKVYTESEERKKETQQQIINEDK